MPDSPPAAWTSSSPTAAGAPKPTPWSPRSRAWARAAPRCRSMPPTARASPPSRRRAPGAVAVASRAFRLPRQQRRRGRARRLCRHDRGAVRRTDEDPPEGVVAALLADDVGWINAQRIEASGGMLIQPSARSSAQAADDRLEEAIARRFDVLAWHALMHQREHSLRCRPHGKCRRVHRATQPAHVHQTLDTRVHQRAGVREQRGLGAAPAGTPLGAVQRFRGAQRGAGSGGQPPRALRDGRGATVDDLGRGRADAGSHGRDSERRQVPMGRRRFTGHVHGACGQRLPRTGTRGPAWPRRQAWERGEGRCAWVERFEARARSVWSATGPGIEDLRQQVPTWALVRTRRVCPRPLAGGAAQCRSPRGAAA